MISLLISGRNQQIVAVLLALAVFALLIVGTSCFATYQLNATIFAESQRTLEQYVRLRHNVDSTFAELQARVTAEPCSDLFQTQLRQVAYRADGVNEMLYAPGGVVHCSSTANFTANPLPLGKPDILPRRTGGTTLWMDHGLGFVGLQDLTGTIAWRDPFAVVIPPFALSTRVPSWLDMEVVLLGADGRWWHRGGEAGLYQRHQIAAGPRAPAFDLVFHNLICAPGGHHCAVSEASIADILSDGWAYFVLAVVASALLAAWAGTRVRARIRHYWSFEARFVRHLDAGSICCVYQPIMDLKTGEIAGCEVLGRWRDVDGTLVYPDRFIPLVEAEGLTLKLTRLVAERAHAELSALPARRRPLFLSFNIFPRDLDSAVLGPVFENFAGDAGRFDIIVELVESDAIDVEKAQHEIIALRALGIRTFIDDFGTGYSNIQALAALAVDGVKLDRAFAMAPVDGMMSQMLSHAIGMIHIAGRAIVVEGIETRERLDLLRGIVPGIDYVQGYFISRPLDIAALVPFLSESEGPLFDVAA